LVIYNATNSKDGAIGDPSGYCDKFYASGKEVAVFAGDSDLVCALP